MSAGRPGHVVAGRYRLVAQLGQGTFGEVWDAEDMVLGERVAIKRMRKPGPESARTRREIATLRMLRIPGVVRLFDEGDENGCPFFVMERVVGAPFPAARPAPSADVGAAGASALLEGPTATLGSSDPSTAATPGPPPRLPRWEWESIAGVTEALLDTLRRVHAAGIVHRDLKPANVLVRQDGRPVVVDFGLCLPTAEGASLGEHDDAVTGTPAYLAPEQIHGGPIDARADLYAVGVMLYEALTGCLPHEASTPAALFVLRATQRPVPARRRVASIPPAVADLVDGLLAPSPATRPQSAAEVLEALRGRGLARPSVHRGERLRSWPLPEGDGPLDEVTLQSLFYGRDRLFHLREDAARALRERTGGERSRVQEEITAWIHAGIARPDRDALFVDRDALDRIELGFPSLPSNGSAGLAVGAPGRLLALVASGNDEAAAEEALIVARDFAERGRLGLAAAVLEDGLRAARRVESTRADLETALLAEWVKVAFAERIPHALDRVLHELCRARHRASPEVARMEGLVRAAIAVRSFFSAEPAASMEELGAFSEPALERWRHWVRIRACMFVNAAAATRALVDAEAWSESTDDAAPRAAVAGFRGTLAFVEGRFSEAAHWHASAAAGERWITLRIAQMINEAAALVEAFEPARACAVAQRAAALAARCRHPFFEGRAEWTARTAEYRTCAAMTPDLELVEALSDLGEPNTLGSAYLTEAVIAFRRGARALSSDLAARAADTWRRAGRHHPAMLARALAGALGDGLPQSEAEALAALAAQCRVPGIGIQTLGLLKWACPELPSPPAEVVASLCAQVPLERRGDRLDVLSVDEALAALRSGPRPP